MSQQSTGLEDVVEDLNASVEHYAALLHRVTEEESEVRPAPGKWSKKEILGHLIDSASNNHQRFVRAQLAGELRFPAYDQDEWVATQGYHREPWALLVNLWKGYNLHLARVMKSADSRRLGNRCVIGDDDPVTLEFLMRDYVQHLKHHMKQMVP
ncbi:MAG: DinB family protein [Planctomycetes bacterium]|nr:DinB family protein [Planctomycetota bacterium]